MYNLQRFTLVESVLGAEEVESLRDRLDYWEAKVDEQQFLGRAGHVANLPNLDPVFLPLQVDPHDGFPEEWIDRLTPRGNTHNFPVLPSRV